MHPVNPWSVVHLSHQVSFAFEPFQLWIQVVSSIKNLLHWSHHVTFCLIQVLVPLSWFHRPEMIYGKCFTLNRYRYHTFYIHKCVIKCLFVSCNSALRTFVDYSMSLIYYDHNYGIKWLKTALIRAKEVRTMIPYLHTHFAKDDLNQDPVQKCLGHLLESIMVLQKDKYKHSVTFSNNISKQ